MLVLPLGWIVCDVVSKSREHRLIANACVDESFLPDIDFLTEQQTRRTGDGCLEGADDRAEGSSYRAAERLLEVFRSPESRIVRGEAQNGVKMAGHHNEAVCLRVGEVHWNVLPMALCNQADIVEEHLPVPNLAEEPVTAGSVDCHEPSPGPSVVRASLTNVLSTRVEHARPMSTQRANTGYRNSGKF